MSRIRKKLSEIPQLLRGLRSDIEELASTPVGKDKKVPPVEYGRRIRIYQKAHLRHPRTFTRIMEPVVSLKEEIVDFVRREEDIICQSVNPLLHDEAIVLKKVLREIFKVYRTTKFTIEKDDDAFLSYANHCYQMTSEHELDSAHIPAVNMTRHDLSLSALLGKDAPTDGFFVNRPSKVPDFSLLYRKAVKKMQFSRTDIDQFLEKTLLAGENVVGSASPAHGASAYWSGKRGKIILWSHQRLSFLVDLEKGKVFVSCYAMGQLLLSKAETLRNLTIAESVTRGSTVSPFLGRVCAALTCEETHTRKVEAFALFEQWCLFLSDMDTTKRNNHVALVVMLREMLDDCRFIFPGIYTVKDLLIFMLTAKPSQLNPIGQLFVDCIDADGLLLQTLSSLHKPACYGIVSEESGLEKVMNRSTHVHEVSDEMLVDLECFLRRDLTLTFCSKEGKLLKFKGPSSKVTEMQDCLATSAWDVIENKPLRWWEDVVFDKNFESTSECDLITRARSKGVAKHRMTGQPSDGENEIVHICKRKTVPTPDLKVIKRERERPFKVSSGKIGSFSVNGLFNAKRNCKGREMKTDARYFVSATCDVKHMISEQMEKGKKVLSYVSGEMMTMSESERSDALFTAAGYMNEERAYTLMTDISGHCTSMTPRSTGFIYKVVGELYGEPDYERLPSLFNQLKLMYSYEFENKAVLTEGQIGGVEGFYNPIWTIHNAVCQGLFVYKEGLNAKARGVYSDDSFLTVILETKDLDQLVELLSSLRRHYKATGQIIKAAQTCISPTRVTMLRRHYFNGLKADAFWKKYATLSLFHSTVIISDQADTDGVVSTLTSAVDGSPMVILPTYVKWLFTILMSVRSFTRNFSALIRGSKNMWWPKDEPMYEYTRACLVPDQTTFRMAEEMMKQVSVATYTDRQKKAWFISNILTLTEGMTEHRRKRLLGSVSDPLNFALLRYMQKSDLTLSLYMMFLMLPEKLGGRNVPLYINNALSGHSDGTHKRVSQIYALIKYHWPSKDMFYRALTIVVSRGPVGGELTEGGEGAVMTEEFPVYSIARDEGSILKSYTRKTLRAICVNETISRYLFTGLESATKKKEMLDCVREKFHFRLLSFYYEHSLFGIEDKLLSKVESLSGLLHALSNADSLQATIDRNQNKKFENLLLSHEYKGPVMDREYDATSFLIGMRARRFPNVRFVPLCEMTYDDKLVSAGRGTRIATVRMTKGTRTVEGITMDRLIPRSSAVKLKYDRDSLMMEFHDIRSYSVAMVTMVTKWIIGESMKAMGQRERREFEDADISRVNYVRLADMILASYRRPSFKLISHYFVDISGGEVGHRVPNARFKNKVSINALFESCMKFQTDLDTSIFEGPLGFDSNMNLNYVKFRVTIAEALKSSVFRLSSGIATYKLENKSNLVDVRMNFCHVTDRPFVAKRVETLTLDTADRDLDRYMARLEEQNQVITSVTHAGSETVAEITRDITANNLPEVIYKIFMQIRAAHPNITIRSASYICFQPYEPIFLAHIPEEHSECESLRLAFLRSCLKEHIDANIYTHMLSNQSSAGALIQPFVEDHFGRCKRTTMNFIKGNIKLLVGTAKDLSSLGKRGHRFVTPKLLSELDRARGEISLFVTVSLFVRWATDVRYWRGEETTMIDDRLDDLELKLVNHVPHEHRDDRVVSLLTLLGEDVCASFLRRNRDTIKHHVNLIRDEFRMRDRVIKFKYPPKGSRGSFKLDDSYERTIRSATCDIDRIPKSFFHYYPALKPIMNQARNFSHVYGNPVIFDSKCASNTYASSEILFNGLESRGIVRRDFKVLDATAGRGDMLKLLVSRGYDVKGYTRKDDWYKEQPNSRVEAEADYDAFTVDSLGRMAAYDLAIYDTTFLKREITTDVLTDMIEASREGKTDLLIRLNHIAELPKKWGEKGSDLAEEYFLVGPSGDEIILDKFYLYVRQKMSSRGGIVTAPKELIKKYHQYLVRITSRQKVIENLDYSSSNDLSVYLDKTPLLSKYTTRLCTGGSIFPTDRTSEEFKKLWRSMPRIVFSADMVPPFERDELCEGVEETSSLEGLNYSDIDPCRELSMIEGAYYSRMLSVSRRRGGVRHSVAPDEVGPRLAQILSVRHPNASVRRLFEYVFFIHYSAELDGPMNETSLDLTVYSNRGNEGAFTEFSPNRLDFVLSLIAISKSLGDIRSGATMLLNLMVMEKGKKEFYRSLLIMYRKLCGRTRYLDLPNVPVSEAARFVVAYNRRCQEMSKTYVRATLSSQTKNPEPEGEEGDLGDVMPEMKEFSDALMDRIEAMSASLERHEEKMIGLGDDLIEQMGEGPLDEPDWGIVGNLFNFDLISVGDTDDSEYDSEDDDYELEAMRREMDWVPIEEIEQSLAADRAEAGRGRELG